MSEEYRSLFDSVGRDAEWWNGREWVQLKGQHLRVSQRNPQRAHIVISAVSLVGNNTTGGSKGASPQLSGAAVDDPLDGMLGNAESNQAVSTVSSAEISVGASDLIGKVELYWQQSAITLFRSLSQMGYSSVLVSVLYEEQKTYEVQLLADVELSSSDRWNDSRRRATTEFIRHSNRFSNSQTLTTSPSFGIRVRASIC